MTTTTTTKEQTTTTTTTRVQVYTLYLVRHGEALHNVLEKAAQQKVRDEASSDMDATQVEALAEEARKAVLEDATLLDSPLTSAGKEQACQAGRVVKELHATQGLPLPTVVFVSPLQRALQTADRVFPDCTNIHVRAILQERQTGKPCDQRCPENYIDRASFARFSTNQICQEDLLLLEQQQQQPPSTGTFLTPIVEEEQSKSSSTTTSPALERQSAEDCLVEGKEMLRVRTGQVFRLLAKEVSATENKDQDNSSDNSNSNNNNNTHAVCIVTHKGYLRELERGYLGHPHATEFGNAEVRVYRITMNVTLGTLVHAQRLYPSTTDE